MQDHMIYGQDIQLNKDAQSYEILKKMKNIFDPNNIMNTGKLTLK
jgi:FAD/FMN-containing dehydrogenase